MKEIVSSLDIGSNYVKLVVGEYYNNSVHVLASSCVKSKGVKNGIIVNPEEAIISLKEAFSRCEELLNTKINKVVLVVSSYYTEFIKVSGKTTITNEDGKILDKDIVRVLQSCVYNKIPSNKEIVNIMPVIYKLDGKTKGTDILNKKCSSLECNAIMSLVPKKNVYTAFSVLDNIGIEVVDISLGGLCDYFEFRDEKLSKLKGAVINIGYHKTEVSIIEKDIIISCEVLDIGSKSIDNDLCYVYDISKRDSVKLKERFALFSKRNASSSWNQEILTINGETITINQYEISEVVYSRIKEILELSKKQINLLTKDEISYIIVVGGSSLGKDIEVVLEEVFYKGIQIFKVKEMGARHNMYSSALGLIKYYHYKLSQRNKLAYTFNEEEQKEVLNVENKKEGILGKIHRYFWNS